MSGNKTDQEKDQEQERDVDDTDLNELFEDEDDDADEEVVTKADDKSDKDDETDDESEDDQDESEDDDTKDKSDDEETGDEDESEPPADGDDDRKMVPIKALHDERRKARELKKELDELKKKEGHSEDELGIGPEPDRFENPEEHDAWLVAKVKAEDQLAKNKAYQDSVDESRERALEKYEDYEEKEGIFLMLARKDPKLREDMIDSSDVAEFVYKTAAKWEADKEVKLLEKLKAEGKLKEEKEEAPNKKTVRKKRPSLATATGTGRVTEDSSEFDPNDLDDLVGDPGY